MAGRAEEGDEVERGQETAKSSWRQLKLHADTLPVRSNERWEANLAALQAYVEEHGGRQPSRYRSSACAEERKLAMWRAKQRTVRRGTAEGVLSTAQERQLEQVRGWSWGAAAGRTETGVDEGEAERLEEGKE